MDVTPMTWLVAGSGLVLMLVLAGFQFVALVRPRSRWTIENIYGGDPAGTDPTAYFAFNQGMAWADVAAWAPLQIAASIGMMAGQRWGFILGLVASAPYWYTAITMFVWDRALDFRRRTIGYWVIWAVWPSFGVVEGSYCALRLW